MKVLFTIAGLQPEHGGPSHSVPALAEALSRAGTAVEIFTQDYGPTWKPPLPPAAELVTTNFVDISSPLARRLQWSPRFKQVLRARAQSSGAEIIHDTGLWLLTNHAAAQVARTAQLPLIISPRGMLTEWSLQFKGWKKKLAWQLYQQRDVRSAQVLHATSTAEAEGFRALGLPQPIAVIPNGVALLDSPKSNVQSPKSEIRTLLFLSRIHPKKGLLDLVTAWGRIRPSGWRMVIAGGDEGGHLQELKAEIGKLKLEKDFEFTGPVEGAAKWELYRNADLFVLPSHSENFGIVVAEALACGVPVIASQGTPWEDLVTHRCGWWPEIGSEPLAAALREALARTDEERREMGARGRELVQAKYGWPGMAAKMIEVYRWMIKLEPRPDCVMD